MRYLGRQNMFINVKKSPQLQCIICIIQHLAVRKIYDNQEDKANISRNYIKLMYNLYKAINLVHEFQA